MQTEELPPKKIPPGAPAWVLTFADLMSLLLAFFVLLFSFSEMDKQKFKELSGSLKDAFGVQREVPARETPLGTSIIAREFSPGRTQATIRNEVRQESMNEMKRYALAIDMEKVGSALEEEIGKGLVEVDSDGEQVITVRIREMGSFTSGSADLADSFAPVIKKIIDMLHEIDGPVVVSGHTDPLPIHTERFRSNWDLASARAATVLHRIVAESDLPNSRFQVAGYADTKPIADNDTAEGRARNRRVEIVLLRDELVRPDGSMIQGSQNIDVDAPVSDPAAMLESLQNPLQETDSNSSLPWNQ